MGLKPMVNSHEVATGVRRRIKRKELMMNGKLRLFLVCGHMVIRTKQNSKNALCPECGKLKNLEYVEE